MTASSSKDQDGDGEILEGEPIQSDAAAWAAIGRKLLEESMEVTREYAKLMIQFSFGAIPIYVALVGLVVSDDLSRAKLSFIKELVLLAPVTAYLISGCIFVLALYPRAGSIVLDVVEAIRVTHQRLLRRRSRLSLAGTLLFSLAVGGSALILQSQY